MSHYIIRSLLVALCVGPLLLASAPADAQSLLQASAPTRARLGLEAGLGAALGDTRGGAFSLAGQLGVQINDVTALYWQPGLFVDGWAAEGEQTDVYVFGSQLAMIDFTFARWFQLGFGGGVDVGRFGICEGPRSDPTCEFQGRQVQPAAEGRLAAIIPLPGLRARWGIPITARFHTTFFNGQQIHNVVLQTGILRF